MSTTELNQLNIRHGVISGIAGVAAGVDDRQAEEYRKGYGDGIVWAGEYATADELRQLVEKSERGPHDDSPHWRGFLAGAEEVLDERECM